MRWVGLAGLLVWASMGTVRASNPAVDSLAISSGGLRTSVAGETGGVLALGETAGRQKTVWLRSPIALNLTNESTHQSSGAMPARAHRLGAAIQIVRQFAGQQLSVSERWSAIPGGLAWDLSFVGSAPRTGCELTFELPLLSASRLVFTPTERGVVRLDRNPSATLTPYGSSGWDTSPSHFNVLPLVSVFDPPTGRALTIALPPDTVIPDLRIAWRNATTLQIRLGHRGMGADRTASVRLLLLAHPADYRSVIRAYADLFPAWFKSPMPGSNFEGAFYYHHIQDHPDYAEMARQDVRFIWTSFWFTYLGNYMPAEPEWYPYTYAKMWSLGQTMTDAKIRHFVDEMHSHGIGSYAYFNVTEFGGSGGKSGGTEEAAQALKTKFANALVKDVAGNDIPTWEGAMAMNADPRYALFPFLKDQVTRHLQRVPDIDGFCIDRLDWANHLDYGHDDGVTMVGNRTAASMAGPVAAGVGEVCRQSHAAGKKVFVNQFWRVEPLKDVDGYCHEADFVRGLGYLAPYRPVSGWHQQRPYDGDLLLFETQLKTRLQFAVFPQMIAHEFPISQQAASPTAADMLETYAPLFYTLHGKRQVMIPNCVHVAGANDVNLFVNGDNRYVVVVTSRVRFQSRGKARPEPVQLTINVQDGRSLQWAHVVSADCAEYRAPLRHNGDKVVVDLLKHCTASCVVAGTGAEPALVPFRNGASTARQNSSTLAAKLASVSNRSGVTPGSIARHTLYVRGLHVGTAVGSATLYVNGRMMGGLHDGVCKFDLSLQQDKPAKSALELAILTGDEGTWYAVERAELMAQMSDGSRYRVAKWTSDTGRVGKCDVFTTTLEVERCVPEEVQVSTAQFVKTSTLRQSLSPADAHWSPMSGDAVQNGYRLEVLAGTPFVWAPKSEDVRLPDQRSGGSAAECWFAAHEDRFMLAPPNRAPYTLTLFVLDFDRNGRALSVELSDETGPLDTRPASVKECGDGAYLAWRVSGPISIRVRKTAGFNAVVSAIYVESVP